jgi:RNA polymerase sigma-70 factor (ECF subfamily)
MAVPGAPNPYASAPDPDTDFDLMARIAAGEDAAFGLLSDRWRPRLVNFLRGMGADQDGAEDCAQETLLRVYRYRGEYEPRSPFPSFLFTLARRSFMDWRRKTSRYAPPRDDLDAAPEPDPLPSRGAHLDLVAAVADLPRHLRDVVELGAIRGLPYNRVAVLLGIPVGTVKSRMHHAVLRLREALGDGGPSRE